MNYKYMSIALKLADKAYKKSEVPVGCVIVNNDKIISKAYNQKEKKHCCLEHAELIAIKQASKKQKNWRLEECELYVTLEPCKMCFEAIVQARITKVYYLLDSKFDCEKNISVIKKINHDDVLIYKNKLQKFFKTKR